MIGTEFNISRHAGRTAVTVRRGVVAVAQASGGEVRLTRGQQVLHTEGTNVQEVRGADPEAVFAWRAGRLIYDNTPLADVVAEACKAAGLKEVGFIGTTFAMERSFFTDRIASHGLTVHVPPADHHEVVTFLALGAIMGVMSFIGLSVLTVLISAIAIRKYLRV